MFFHDYKHLTKLAFYQIGILSTNRTFQYRVHEPLPFMIMHVQRLIPYSNAIGHPSSSAS